MKKTLLAVVGLWLAVVGGAMAAPEYVSGPGAGASTARKILETPNKYYIGGGFIWATQSGDFGGGAMAGIRFCDYFRAQVDYAYADGNAAMVFGFLDARISDKYGLFYDQRIVPYIGAGAGAAWGGSGDDAAMAFGVAAGILLGAGKTVDFDIGYRQVHAIGTSHQVRAGLKFNF